MLPDPHSLRALSQLNRSSFGGYALRHGQQEELELVPADHKVSQTFRIGFETWLAFSRGEL